MMVAEAQNPGVSLQALLRSCAASDVPELVVQGLALDSRQVSPGDVFIALKGRQAHGLACLEQALQRGAVAVLREAGSAAGYTAELDACSVPVIEVEQLRDRGGVIADAFYAQPSRDLHCIGVTGTDGKTSVTHFIAQALHAGGHACGLLGTLGYGVYGKLVEPTHTTPDALRLHAELASLRDRQVKTVVMEVSSHALDQGRVEGVRFDSAVLTNLSREHLDYHGDMSAYAAAKQRLFRTPGLQTRIINADDELGQILLKAAAPDSNVIAYSTQGAELRASHWLRASRIECHAQGLRFELDSSYGKALIESRLFGHFNVANLLAALAALLDTGMSFQTAVERLAAVSTVPGRMEVFGAGGQPRLVVDYAHTPHALATVLQALRLHATGKLVCVFGAGGDRDKGKRPLMGAVAEQYADRVILTNDNPRSENPQLILDAITAGTRQPEAIERIPDRAEAIRTAIAEAAENDTVLIAGKGHEATQQLATQRIHLSDRELVVQILQERDS